MARIAGVDLPREKRVEIGLTYIYGIGRSAASKIIAGASAFYYGDPLGEMRLVSRVFEM